MAWMDYQDDQGLKENQVCSITVNCVIIIIYLLYSVYSNTGVHKKTYYNSNPKK